MYIGLLKALQLLQPARNCDLLFAWHLQTCGRPCGKSVSSCRMLLQQAATAVQQHLFMAFCCSSLTVSISKRGKVRVALYTLLPRTLQLLQRIGML